MKKTNLLFWAAVFMLAAIMFPYASNYKGIKYAIGIAQPAFLTPVFAGIASMIASFVFVVFIEMQIKKIFPKKSFDDEKESEEAKKTFSELKTTEPLFFSAEKTIEDYKNISAGWNALWIAFVAIMGIALVWFIRSGVYEEFMKRWAGDWLMLATLAVAAAALAVEYLVIRPWKNEKWFDVKASNSINGYFELYKDKLKWFPEGRQIPVKEIRKINEIGLKRGDDRQMNYVFDLGGEKLKFTRRDDLSDRNMDFEDAVLCLGFRKTKEESPIPYALASTCTTYER